jgi:phosphoribosylformylglycinamidine synthase
MVYKAKVTITLRKSILDAQGSAIEKATHKVGYNNVSNIRVGKIIELNVEAKDKAEAKEIAGRLSNELLANTVMEDFSVEIYE